MEGTYYLNRLFATVEMIPKTIVEVGTVGGGGFLHTARSAWISRASITATASWWKRAAAGVWSEPLLPGKYAFNTYAGKVIIGARPPTSSSSGSAAKLARTASMKTCPRFR